MAGFRIPGPIGMDTNDSQNNSGVKSHDDRLSLPGPNGLEYPIPRLVSATSKVFQTNYNSSLKHFKNINDVISFIHIEMIRNEKSTDVAYIRDNLGIWQWDNLLPGKTSIDSIQAYFRWYEKVKGGSDWDHKGEIKSKYGEWSCDLSKRILYNFDIWSNIHYGYIGLAANFDEWSLLAGAGVAQKLARTNPPGYWSRRLQQIGDADFLAAFDDPDDQEAIKVGFELWKSFKTNVSKNNILEAVRNHSSRLKTSVLN